jgi:GNAT superfamily N-acetyltransferase
LIATAALLATHDPGVELPAPEDVLIKPHHARYFAHWPLPGDFGVVGESGGEHLGAAWCRLFGREELEHTAMTPGLPEVVVAVLPTHQRCGVGTELLRAVMDDAWRRGHTGVELTVGRHRRWLVEVYERSGFRTVAETEQHLVMRSTPQ